MTIIAALHVLLIWYVPWGTKWVPAIVIGAIDSVDFCILLWILAVVGRLGKTGTDGTFPDFVRDRGASEH